MCSIGSCVLYKHTQSCRPNWAFVYIDVRLRRAEAPNSEPGFGHLCWKCMRRVRGRREGRKGLLQLQDDMVAITVGHHFRVFWLFPKGNSPDLLMGVRAHAAAHVWESCVLHMPETWTRTFPSLGSSPACSWLNQETQSWALSIWSLCGRNRCGLGARAGAWEPETPDQSLQLVIYCIFFLFIDYFFNRITFLLVHSYILCRSHFLRTD